MQLFAIPLAKLCSSINGCRTPLPQFGTHLVEGGGWGVRVGVQHKYWQFLHQAPRSASTSHNGMALTANGRHWTNSLIKPLSFGWILNRISEDFIFVLLFFVYILFLHCRSNTFKNKLCTNIILSGWHTTLVKRSGRTFGWYLPPFRTRSDTALW